MKPKTEFVAIETLILNFDIYPRHEINPTNVSDLVKAMEAGVRLPPVLSDTKTKFIVDGVHTTQAHKRLKRTEIEVEWRDFADVGAMLEESIRRNMHGRALAPYDKARCIQLAEAFGLSMDRLAGAMGLTMIRLDELRIRKTAFGPDSRIVPIKQTLSHLAGQQLEETQMQGNREASGVRAIVYVNQLINCLQHKLIDRSDEKLMAALEKLQGLLGKCLRKQRA